MWNNTLLHHFWNVALLRFHLILKSLFRQFCKIWWQSRHCPILFRNVPAPSQSCHFGFPFILGVGTWKLKLFFTQSESSPFVHWTLQLAWIIMPFFFFPLQGSPCSRLHRNTLQFYRKGSHHQPTDHGKTK